MIDYVRRRWRRCVPTLFARRYVRPIAAVSRSERAVGIVILLLVAAVVVAFVAQVATDREHLFNVPLRNASDASASPQPPTSASPFPDPGLPGWRTPDRIERFTPDELYVKIDGRAEVYLQHHVAGLVFGSYTHEAEAGRAIDIHWYDMGSPENAAAIFQAEAPPAVAAVPVGDAGYQVGGAVFFRQGSSYVQVLPVRLGDEDGATALKIATRIAASKP